MVRADHHTLPRWELLPGLFTVTGMPARAKNVRAIPRATARRLSTPGTASSSSSVHSPSTRKRTIKVA